MQRPSRWGATVVAAIATPFEADLSPSRPRLAHHARWLLANGCDGLVLFGSTGESASLSVAERRRVLDELVADGIPARSLLVGTGCCSLPETLELSRDAIEHGCQGVLVHPPFFFKGVADAGVSAFYSALIDRLGDSRLRLYLYHFPQTVGVGVSADIAEALFERYPGTIAGYKDSSGDFEHTCAALDRLPSLEVFVSTEAKLLPFLARGGAGCVSATANVQPGAVRRLLEGRGTAVEAERQALVAQVRTALEGPQVVSRVKALLAEIHGDPSWYRLRPPLIDLTAADTGQLLARIGRPSAAFAGLTPDR